MYEDVNLLSSYRINTFCADGTSTKYVLDATGIESITEVKVNGSVVTNYTTNVSGGYITFNQAPAKPSVLGQDNVSIKFKKQVSGYQDRIAKCSIMVLFDNRIFFSGNPDYPNAVFHCSLNNPLYISDLDYYECGNSKNPIKSLVVGNNVLWVFKKDNDSKDTIFYLTPNTDSTYGRVYPVSQGNLSVGCYSEALNFRDNIVFFSRSGLERVSGNINYEQSVTHSSSLVDSKLSNESNYEMLNVETYNDYLLVAIDKRIYLADSRQMFTGVNGKEFEWYYWEMPMNIVFMKNYYDVLYYGDNNGKIYRVGGLNDNGSPIVAYWTTPRDDFGYMNHYKKTNKRGSMVKLKNISNGRVKVSVSTNKAPTYEFIKEMTGTGFNFNDMHFDNFSFSGGDNSYKVFRVKRKKIIDISLKIYTDMLDKPFGLTGIKFEAFLSGYVKR